MPKPIKTVALKPPPPARAVRAVELSGEGLVRGAKVIVGVTVTRTDDSKDVQELRGTYRFDPNPHDNPRYNKQQGKFYDDAAKAAAQRVTAAPFALVAVGDFQFTFGNETYRAQSWEPPIGGGYKNRWQVDGPEAPG